MARSKTNLITKDYHGKVGKQFVIKQRGNTSSLTRYPDRSNVKLSQAQKKSCNRFAQAVKYAQSVIRDPALKAKYESKADKEVSAYNLAIRDFLKNLGKVQ